MGRQRLVGQLGAQHSLKMGVIDHYMAQIMIWSHRETHRGPDRENDITYNGPQCTPQAQKSFAHTWQ